MRLLIFFAAIIAAFAVPVAAASKDATLHMTHEWHVSLDAGGKVASLSDDSKLEPAVREPLEREIRGWSFVPGTIDGKPAPTETALTLDVSFLPKPDGTYGVRIDDARTGGTLDPTSSTKAPRFPRDAATPGFVGRVVVKADYDANGRIISVTPQPDESLNAKRSLIAATVRAVQQWKVKPERVGGLGVAASVMVPVCYTVTVGWPRDFDCGWMPPGTHAKIENGGSFALAPTAKLATDVIGHTL